METELSITDESIPPQPAAAQSPEAKRRDPSPEEKSALWSWLGFTGTFAAVRAITHSIRNGWGLFGNVKLGNTHVHHYMWGIAMICGVGGSDSR